MADDEGIWKVGENWDSPGNQGTGGGAGGAGAPPIPLEIRRIEGPGDSEAPASILDLPALVHILTRIEVARAITEHDAEEAAEILEDLAATVRRHIPER